MTLAQSMVAPPWRLGLALSAMMAVVAGLCVLFLFDPLQYHIYPVCLLHQTTGLLCPGCGTLRALHQLTHGHFEAAWKLNAFSVTLLPLAGWLLVRELVFLTTGKRWPGIVNNPVFGWTLLAAFILFGILRNVPFQI